MFYGPMKVRKLVGGLVLLGVSVVAVQTFAYPNIAVRQFSAGGSAARYVEEFQRTEQVYPGGARDGANSPDGKAAVELKWEPGIPLFGDSCHSVWLSKSGARVRILRLMEGDPGSGSSFGFAWSHDSRAVFVSGSYSGFNCSLTSRGKRLRVIYTLEDGVAWELPALPEVQ